MSDIKLFIATTIDGFIAREDGSLDWLPGSDPEAQEPQKDAAEADPSAVEDGGYGAFIAGIDVVVMGRKTYEEVLGFGVEWPYGDCRTYVITSDKNYAPTTTDTSVLHQINAQTLNEIRSASQKGVWLVGGGQLVTAFMNHGAIDEMTLTLVPVILGKGIRLFPNNPLETKFELVESQAFASGMVNVIYRRLS